MQLFRGAFTSRICDRRLFHPSLYIPGTVFTIPSLPLPLETADQPSATFLLSREEPPSTLPFSPPPPRTKEEIFLHIRWGVIVRQQRNKFPAPSRLCSIPPPFPSSSNVARSLERAFKSSTNPPFPPFFPRPAFPPEGSTLAMGRDDGVWGMGSTFSTKHGRPPRPSRDRFFPRTIYSFTFYSHRAFDNSWMAEDKLVSTLADHLSLPFRSGCGGCRWMENVFWRNPRVTGFLVLDLVFRGLNFF